MFRLRRTDVDLLTLRTTMPAAIRDRDPGRQIHDDRTRAPAPLLAEEPPARPDPGRPSPSAGVLSGCLGVRGMRPAVEMVRETGRRRRRGGVMCLALQSPGCFGGGQRAGEQVALAERAAHPG